MTSTEYETLEAQPENKFSKLVQNQKIIVIPEFELESGDYLYQVPVAYKTWGKLNEKGNNCMVICHALTGSSDISDWWGPLLGKDKAFDTSRFFVICLNSLGSPYGSASPMTNDPATGHRYGPEFPLTTIRDDVKLHKKVLDNLGVRQIAVVIGGSMGGMLTLEYPCIFNDPETKYVRSIVALATSARHSAWCISWSEAQRQSIYSDPKYNDGYYDIEDGPVVGLSAARMAALLTYRSRNSFESRFGRNDPHKVTNVPKSKLNLVKRKSSDSSDESITSPREENWNIHNDGHKLRKSPVVTPALSNESSQLSRSSSNTSVSTANTQSINKKKTQTFFTAQSYLRYQGEKFISRYDPNCYISITRKLDTHDLSRDRYINENGEEKPITMEQQLNKITNPALIIGVTSDGLFTIAEQEYLAKHIPNSELYTINSPEGHDAFLLEFMEINSVICEFEKKYLPDILAQTPIEVEEVAVQENSLFGEAEDVTNW